MKKNGKIIFVGKVDKLITGNLALDTKKNNVGLEKIENNQFKYEQPKILKLVPKKTNKIFCGCWQVANQEDAC